MGLDTKTDRLTNRQSQCDSDSDPELIQTSIVALRVVEGDKKGSLKPERVKYGGEFHGTWTQE
jgi:hypothetical protein